jgi:hypothetical protein
VQSPGLSFGTCVFFAATALIWLAALSVVYALTAPAEYFVNPAGVRVFRRRAYAVIILGVDQGERAGLAP